MYCIYKIPSEHEPPNQTMSTSVAPWNRGVWLWGWHFLAIGNWQNAGFIWHQMYFFGGGCGVLAGNERLCIKLWGINIQLGQVILMLAKWPGSLHMVEHMGLSENGVFPGPKWWSSNVNSNFERYAPCSDPPIVTKLIQVELSLDWLKDNLRIIYKKPPYFIVNTHGFL